VIHEELIQILNLRGIIKISDFPGGQTDELAGNAGKDGGYQKRSSRISGIGMDGIQNFFNYSECSGSPGI
jgi:hypothetical protein